MYIIDNSFFTRELNIPNLTAAQSLTKDELNSFGEEKPRLLLQSLLGLTEFADLDTYVVNGVFNANNNAPQRWKDFVNGVEYANDNGTFKWNGLIQIFGTYKKSLLANYTYCEWLLNNITIVSGIGEVQLQGQNSTPVNSTQRLVNVWNDFVVMYQGNYRNGYFQNYAPTFEYVGFQNDDQISMLQFLSDNSTDFPNVNYRRYEVKNQLGI